MKKFITLLVIFLFIHSFCLYADDVESFDDDPMEIGKKKPFGMEDRGFEIGLANFNFNFANNFLTIKEVFQDVVSIDIDKLSDGFKLNLGLNVTPFYFTFKSKKGWGFGLSTNIETMGIIGISGNMLTFHKAKDDNSDISGALFGSATINALFDVWKLKVNVNPSLFYTLAYITPSPNSSSSLVYTLDYPNGETIMCIDYGIRLYTGFPLDSNDGFSLTAKPGFDFSVGVGYQLAKEIGLSKILPFLDFDVSLDLIHIPLISSKIEDYTELKGRIGSDKPITLLGGDSQDGSDFFSSFETAGGDTETGKKVIDVYRPFKLIARADWRPLFGARLLTVTPIIGFCVNTLYYEPVSLEWGVNACLNLANFFLVKAGINFTDRMWVNSLGIALNLRALEIDLGLDIRSQTFAQSWSGGGMGVNFGLKFGW
ncbi:hypothetical protein R84B8_03237 [Treponema sp. R8-4-B8]